VTAAAVSRRTALITGLSGQDGSFLAELLLDQGYDVMGTVRGQGDGHLGAAEHLRGRIELIKADLLEPERLARILAEVQPAELYHLAGPSFVPDSWDHPARTQTEISSATAALLQGVVRHTPTTRTFIAVTGAIFGDSPESPQHEDSIPAPLSPYAVAKLAAHQLAGLLRDHAGIYVCSGILYNHESERRPEHFVSRRITKGAAAISLGLAREVVLGDLEAIRDWSFAGDIVRGAWLTLQQEHPDDYILASGVPHTVAQLADSAFSCVGLDAREHIRVDPGLVRRAEGAPLVGDPARARERLGWHPTQSFEQLIERMVKADLRQLSSAHY
jgi:GDPmannose 4,6-dehydratase